MDGTVQFLAKVEPRKKHFNISMMWIINQHTLILYKKNL